MKKVLIYLLVGLLVIGGFFYLTLDKKVKDNDLISQEDEDGNHGNNIGSETPEKDDDKGNGEVDKDGDQNKDQHGPIRKERAIEIGSRLPNFKLKDINGQEKTLIDYEAEGKIIFLNFWASWCPPCRQEMPDFEKLIQEHDDVIVVAVNVEDKRDRPAVEKFLDEGDYNFEILLDDEGQVGPAYSTGSLPTTFFIDKEGVYRDYWPGMLTYEQMEQVVDHLQ